MQGVEIQLASQIKVHPSPTHRYIKQHQGTTQRTCSPKPSLPKIQKLVDVILGSPKYFAYCVQPETKMKEKASLQSSQPQQGLSGKTDGKTRARPSKPSPALQMQSSVCSIHVPWVSALPNTCICGDMRLTGLRAWWGIRQRYYPTSVSTLQKILWGEDW